MKKKDKISLPILPANPNAITTISEKINKALPEEKDYENLADAFREAGQRLKTIDPFCHYKATIISRIKQKAKNLIKKINIKKTFRFKPFK